MTYVVVFVLVIILLIALASIIMWKIAKARGVGKGKRILLVIGISLLSNIIFITLCMQIHYHADEVGETALNGNENVAVSQIGSDYFFDGPGDDKALIFIPGARVEEAAYGPLLLKISQEGVDCFLVKVPLRMATFGLNAADRVLDNYEYDCWYMAGHSLGGVISAFYAEEHSDMIDGIVLLAAYPTKKIPDSIEMLSVYGDKDACLSMRAYEKYRVNWPLNSSEIIIEGGNHGNFGNYGKQLGDSEAVVSREEQQRETAEGIIEFILD